MRKHGKCLYLLIGASIAWTAPALSQPAAQPPTQIQEIYRCNYVGDNGLDELVAVSERFNAWADRNGITGYTASIGTPVLYNAESDYDVLWNGTSRHGTNFGATFGQWLAEGGDMQAEFREVIDCATHELSAEIVVRRPTGPLPEAPVVAFQNCSLREGRTPAEGVTAATRWAEFTEDNGFDLFMSQLYPLGGWPEDVDYNFRAVVGFPSTQNFGEFLDLLTGNGFQGLTALQNNIDPFLTCDNPSLYSLTWVRTADMQG